MVNKLTKGKKVLFWWSASELVTVTFTRWKTARNDNGKNDTNVIGVGAVVESDWLFEKHIVKKIPSGLKRGQCLLSPYVSLYLTRKSALKRTREVKRPAVQQLRK